MRRLAASTLRRLAALAVLLSVYAPKRLSAQTDSTAYRAAVDLAAAGRVDSARAILRRLVIDNANSPWADDALMQLAMMAFAAGNPALAIEYTGRLRLDYPGSDLRSRAALWAGRAALEAGEPRTGCAMLDTSATESAADIEFANQVAFYRSRCAGLLAAAPPARDTAVTGFFVQVAAARSETDANRIAAQLRTAGHAVRLSASPEGFTRVRMGPYASRELAEAAIRAARDLTGSAPFIVRDP